MIVGFESVNSAEINPFTDRAEDRQSGKDERNTMTEQDFYCAGTEDGAEQRQQDSSFQPWEVEFAYHG